MPYLSHNYRYQPRSRVKSFTETVLFVSLSTVAVFAVLLVMGWFTAFAAEI